MIYSSCFSVMDFSASDITFPGPVTVLRLHLAKGTGASVLGVNGEGDFPYVPSEPGPGSSWWRGSQSPLTAGLGGWRA